MTTTIISFAIGLIALIVAIVTFIKDDIKNKAIRFSIATFCLILTIYFGINGFLLISEDKVPPVKVIVVTPVSTEISSKVLSQPVQSNNQEPQNFNLPISTLTLGTTPPINSEYEPSATTKSTQNVINPNLIHNELISEDTLAKIVGGSPLYWTQRGPVVWGYSNPDHNVVFHHPGDNMILTYWAGFGDPKNSGDCQITVPQNDNMTKYVKCPPGTKAEIIADQVGLHIIDYTGYFTQK
jgi:hypothetical protein